MAIALAVIIAVGVLLYVFTRLTRARSVAEPEEKEPRKSRRQQKLDRLLEMNPMPEPRSMFDLMMEEATELGIEEIPGGDDLEMPVRLKVFHRDEGVRATCRGQIRYVVADGVDPALATVDEVRLVCDEEAPVAAAEHADGTEEQDDAPTASEDPAPGDGSRLSEDADAAHDEHAPAD